MTDYELEKWIWTEQDIEQMGWHDATVYGLQLKENLVLDIDYIFQWNRPDMEGFYITFWVAPATLVFESPMDLSFELSQSFDDRWLEIQDIEMKLVDNKRVWTVITQQGYISFSADTFRQIIRKKPTLQLGQCIPYDERGGFSFDLVAGNGVSEDVRLDIEERRKRDFEAYELAKRRFGIGKELESLHQKREAGQIQTKDYLNEKRELKALIDSLTFQLRGTRYEVL
ncbi:hypothetical protein [uncultured Imperialibacter sp.]|uniref:hypothetical protein n=1 Tax=uncultured Imperialibacter sp. TaxID=1672639 RepID=UPI0030DD76B7|tara:strand:+ start:2532 stop:3212 length:681 start_codon:yes stop_codon:yes gene_type:complete